MKRKSPSSVYTYLNLTLEASFDYICACTASSPSKKGVKFVHMAKRNVQRTYAVGKRITARNKISRSLRLRVSIHHVAAPNFLVFAIFPHVCSYH